jgi:hypothetical protein
MNKLIKINETTWVLGKHFVVTKDSTIIHSEGCVLKIGPEKVFYTTYFCLEAFDCKNEDDYYKNITDYKHQITSHKSLKAAETYIKKKIKMLKETL